MPLNTITLHWDLTDLLQAGLSATLSITPTAQMSDATDHILIPPVARTYTFTGGTGQLAGIVANDNSAILPAGTGYLISVTAGNGVVIVPQFQTQLLFSNGATQWLDALAVVPVVTTAYQYLPLPSGAATAGAVPMWDGTKVVWNTGVLLDEGAPLWARSPATARSPAAPRQPMCSWPWTWTTRRWRRPAPTRR